jgi:(p)ppGpp synthase/HD superfamily hydrolase
MGAIAENNRRSFNDDVLGSATGRLRRSVERFDGLPIAQAAREFASARHAGQYREIDHPLIAHPIEVGWLLRGDGQPEEVIAAGLLHDVLEKTETTTAELRDRFGVRTARLVEAVSDDPSNRDYEARKRDPRAGVAHADSDTAAVFAADKIAKVRELVLLPPRQLYETNTRAKLAHYRASLKMLRRTAGDVPLVELLDSELNRLIPSAVAGTDQAVGGRRRSPRSARNAGLSARP